MKNCSILVFLLLSIGSCHSAKKEQISLQEKVLFHVPEIKNFKLDGKADEWANNGLKVKLFCDAYGNNLTDSNSLAANFKLGWNKEGLCVFIEKIYLRWV